MRSIGRYVLPVLVMVSMACSGRHRQDMLEKTWKQVTASHTTRQEALALSQFDETIKDCEGDLRVSVYLDNGRQLDLNSIDKDTSHINSFSLLVNYEGGTFQTGRWQPRQLANVYLLLLK